MPLNSIYRYKTIDDLIAKYVPDRHPGKCWIWTGSIDSRGYCRCRWRRKSYWAHRLVYEFLIGAVPKGLELDHLCRTPYCVNPAHLEPVTHKENMRRGSIHWYKQSHWGSRKTHCPKGHAYDEPNTYIDKKGSRVCRECNRQRNRIYYHRMTS